MSVADRNGKFPVSELCHLIFENVEAGICVLSDTGVLKLVNRHLCDLTGFSNTELVGSQLAAFLDSAEKDELLARIQSADESGTSVEVTCLKKDGSQLFSVLSAYRIPDDSRHPKEMVVILNDITIQRGYEESLKRTEANLKAIFNNTLQYFVLLDQQMRVVDFNAVAKQRAKKMLNLDMNIGDKFIKFVVDEAQVEFNQTFASVLKGVPWTTEFQLKNHDAQPYWVEVNLNPILEKDQVTGVCFSLLDINERKLAEDALRKSEERYRLLVENSPDAILILRGLKIIYENAGVAHLLKTKDPNSMIGKSFMDFIRPEEVNQVSSRILAAIKTLTVYPVEERQLVLPDGQNIDVEMTGIPFSYQDTPAIQLIVRDICKRKIAERALLSYQEQLRRLASEASLTEEKERRQIATDIHDQIGTTLSLAKIELENLTDASIPSNLTDSLAGVYDLLDRALSDTRSLTFELSPPVLYELGLKAGIEWLADQIQDRHGLEVKLVDDDKPWPLDEDVRGILFRAVRELLFNVVKHAEADSATVSMRRVDNVIEIEVEDQGVGFETADVVSRTDRTHGFGLFSLGERMSHLGGGLKIDALVGLGTRVTLVAPLSIS